MKTIIEFCGVEKNVSFANEIIMPVEFLPKQIFNEINCKLLGNLGRFYFCSVSTIRYPNYLAFYCSLENGIFYVFKCEY